MNTLKKVKNKTFSSTQLVNVTTDSQFWSYRRKSTLLPVTPNSCTNIASNFPKISILIKNIFQIYKNIFQIISTWEPPLSACLSCGPPFLLLAVNYWLIFKPFCSPFSLRSFTLPPPHLNIGRNDRFSSLPIVHSFLYLWGFPNSTVMPCRWKLWVLNLTPYITLRTVKMFFNFVLFICKVIVYHTLSDILFELDSVLYPYNAY